MAGYEYNPLLKLDLQKKSAVSPSDIQHLEQEIASINEDITDINGDLKNKVPKFFTSIEELAIGEIGQYQGETTEEFTHGFFYERQNGTPAQYEDVTIPSGSKKLIYTNKFDQTQKIVYSIATETLSDSVAIQFSQKGFAWLLDDNVHYNIIHISNPDWLYYSTSLIPETSGLLYSLENTLRSIYHSYADNSISSVRSLFQFINGVLLNSGFRLSTSSAGIYGQITDLVFHINIPLIYTHQGGGVPSTSINTRNILAGDLAAYNYDIDAYISQIYETGVDDQWCYDPSRDCTFSFWYIVITVGALKYILHNSGGSAQYTSQMYRTVSDNGQYERYVDINHLLCVFDSQPVSTSSYWAQNIDIGLYFDYTATIEDTTEAITIRRKIQQYDEYGFPIADVPTAVRRDAQPALNPADFATAAQGTKADTALQGITHGTDGNYVISSIGAKDANNEQSVSVSLTLQPISTAGSGAKGVAEASDVKEYIGNNTATPSQGAKADSALQGVVHGTDGSYITTTVTQKDANNEQTIYTALTLQDIETADEDHKGVAEAANVRNFFNVIAAESEAYGVMWDTANPSPNLTRIGNMRNHALLPVQSAMIGGVLADDGTFTPFDNQADWTQATQARDGSDGQVMVQLPQHWRRCEKSGTYNIVMISPIAIPGYVEVRQQYVSAYEATLQHSTSKLCSVNNAAADYRGGQNDASWDGTYRTLLNRPITNFNLAEFRTFARNRANNTKWNCLTYEAVRTIYWLFVTEYATLNSQADFNSALDANGFRQGGLGIGVSDWPGDAWNAFNGYSPLIPCGILDEYGSGTAIKNFSVYNADTTLAHTFSCNKYRGIEMPFAHIWKYVDGVLVNVESGDGVSTVYATTDTSYFSSTSFANYAEICNSYRVDSYIKDIVFNKEGDIFAISPNGNSTSYYCDQYWGANLPSTTELRAWRFGGTASHGARCGLACSLSDYSVGYRYRYVGSRLCFVP